MSGQCCDVERHSERLMILKTVLDYGLLSVLTVYTPQLGKPEKEKESFWNKLFHLVSCIPQTEMLVLIGEMNAHVGSNEGSCWLVRLLFTRWRRGRNG